MSRLLSSESAYTETTDPLCLPIEQSSAFLAGAPWRRFAVIGDSLALGTGDSVAGYLPMTWADRVVTALEPVVPHLACLNTGTEGATSRDVRDHQLQTVAAFDPDLVHIVCGGNDMWSERVDFTEVEWNLGIIFGKFRLAGAQLLTFAVHDCVTENGDRKLRARFHRYNQILRRVASRQGASVIDLWQHPLQSRPNWLSTDRIHPTHSSQAIIAAEVVRTLQRLIAAGPPVK
ncbi:SGNH/GDSL hydrolase family protein [Nocardia nova]|uniref:SGNH/GDSL hydrolase family protein n=1 Tax=Nocardia nova TaxID=37330 RepID=UPI0007A3EED7|nr:SGNH/GDSL hydrolase family protein [Nocardia nova]